MPHPNDGTRVIGYIRVAPGIAKREVEHARAQIHGLCGANDYELIDLVVDLIAKRTAKRAPHIEVAVRMAGGEADLVVVYDCRKVTQPGSMDHLLVRIEPHCVNRWNRTDLEIQKFFGFHYRYSLQYENIGF